MTRIGTVIEGKYEILKEIGRGGMSVVYLANDTHLNRNWAVKEVRKRGNTKNDEIVVNSLLAEANMVKRLDHPALPRIVDIIDKSDTIYIVMDFIEGESLDKVLREYGAQPEEKVIEWAMQICDVFSYLHSQKPPIIYRDMKPANLMLKPNGNISIIDFGIAREYKEQNLADTTVLGTKGYAPPEQYSGQTDPRSDIFALGMTMHHLLTGIDPRGGEPYAPVRQWNPALSEGIEAIINKCVEPAAENRYQSAAELLVDLQDPARVTRSWRKKLKRRLFAFVAAAGFAVLSGIAGVSLSLAANRVNSQDYDELVNSTDVDKYYEAIDIYPSRVEAYQKLVDYCKSGEIEDDDIKKVANELESNESQLDMQDPEVVQLYYDIGKVYFADYGDSLSEKAKNAKGFFEKASDSSTANFDKKEIASCYYSVCKFMTRHSTTTEPAEAEYTELFAEIDRAMDTVKDYSDNESNYDKISLYYVTLLLIHDEAKYMAGVGIDRQEVLTRMEQAYNNSQSITSSLDYVIDLQSKIEKAYPEFVKDVINKYNDVANRQNGGDPNG